VNFSLTHISSYSMGCLLDTTNFMILAEYHFLWNARSYSRMSGYLRLSKLPQPNLCKLLPSWDIVCNSIYCLSASFCLLMWNSLSTAFISLSTALGSNKGVMKNCENLSRASSRPVLDTSKWKLVLVREVNALLVPPLSFR
jgi:hypothetical protein